MSLSELEKRARGNELIPANPIVEEEEDDDDDYSVEDDDEFDDEGYGSGDDDEEYDDEDEDGDEGLAGEDHTARLKAFYEVSGDELRAHVLGSKSGNVTFLPRPLICSRVLSGEYTQL
jgi:hypothetical protein